MQLSAARGLLSGGRLCTGGPARSPKNPRRQGYDSTPVFPDSGFSGLRQERVRSFLPLRTRLFIPGGTFRLALSGGIYREADVFQVSRDSFPVSSVFQVFRRPGKSSAPVSVQSILLPFRRREEESEGLLFLQSGRKSRIFPDRHENDTHA